MSRSSSPRSTSRPAQSGADVDRSGMMNKTEIVRRGVVPGAISNPAQLATLVATEPIYAGEQVTTRRFATPSERGILAQLTGLQRAISVPGDSDQLLAGTLKDGDHDRRRRLVRRTPEGQTHFTRIILRNVWFCARPKRAAQREGHLGPERARSRPRSSSHRPPGPEAVLGHEERPVALRAASRRRRCGQPGERRERPLTAA